MDPSSYEADKDDIIRLTKQESTLGSPEMCDIQVHAEAASAPEPTEISLNFSPRYVKDWDTSAAFRELYQNWYGSVPFGFLSLLT